MSTIQELSHSLHIRHGPACVTQARRRAKSSQNPQIRVEDISRTDQERRRAGNWKEYPALGLERGRAGMTLALFGPTKKIVMRRRQVDKAHYQPLPTWLTLLAGNYIITPLRCNNGELWQKSPRRKSGSSDNPWV